MKKTTVMIVEDELLISYDINECLTERGFDVTAICRSGQEAVESAIKLKPDVILMDIALEGTMDGIETALKINELINPSIIFITAKHNVKESINNKNYRYITKPYDDENLISIIEEVISFHGK